MAYIIDEKKLMEDFHHWKSEKSLASKNMYQERILTDLKPMIDQAVNPYKSSNISEGMQRVAAIKSVINSLAKYDESRGISLKGFIYKQLFPTGNPAFSIVSKVSPSSGGYVKVRTRSVQHIKAIRDAVNQFKMAEGRKPSIQELTDLVSLPANVVRKVLKDIPDFVISEQVIGGSSLSVEEEGRSYKRAIETLLYELKHKQDPNSKRDVKIIEYVYWEALNLPEPHYKTAASFALSIGMKPYEFTRAKNKIQKKIRELIW